MPILLPFGICPPLLQSHYEMIKLKWRESKSFPHGLLRFCVGSRVIIVDQSN